MVNYVTVKHIIKNENVYHVLIIRVAKNVQIQHILIVPFIPLQIQVIKLVQLLKTVI